MNACNYLASDVFSGKRDTDLYRKYAHLLIYLKYRHCQTAYRRAGHASRGSNQSTSSHQPLPVRRSAQTQQPNAGEVGKKRVLNLDRIATLEKRKGEPTERRQMILLPSFF